MYKQPYYRTSRDPKPSLNRATIRK